MQIKRVGKDRILTLFLSILLAISIVVTATFAAFTANAQATGTITFDASVWVEVTKGYYGTNDSRTNDATTGKQNTITYALTPNYTDLNTGTIYGDGANAVEGTYGNLYFQTGEGATSITPDITYTIGGKGNAYIAFQMEIKFTPTAGTYDSFGSSGSVNLNNIDEWNIYPVFESEFTVKEVVSDGKTEFTFTNLNMGTTGNVTYGLITAQPYTTTDGTSYSKIYTMHVVADDAESLTDTVSLSLDSNTTFALSNIISEFRFATEFSDGNGGTYVAPILAGGSIQLNITCKAGIFAVLDFE